jgi:virulence-associated protein VapD
MPNTIIMFDFDTKANIKNSGSKTAPYGKFRRFAERHGFAHLQGSAYISARFMEKNEVLSFIQLLADDIPWFSGVVRSARIYQVANDFDVGGGTPKQLKLPL